MTLREQRAPTLVRRFLAMSPKNPRDRGKSSGGEASTPREEPRETGRAASAPGPAADFEPSPAPGSSTINDPPRRADPAHDNQEQPRIVDQERLRRVSAAPPPVDQA